MSEQEQIQTDPSSTPSLPTSDTPTTETAQTDAETALAKLVEMTGGDFNREQADKLKEKLAKVRAAVAASEGASTPAAEVPTDAEGKRPGVDRALTGADVDWSEYRLNFNVEHLYKTAVYRNTPQGPKWVAVIDDFVSTTKDFKNFGKKVNKPGTVDGTDQEQQNLGMYLNDMLNGRDQWKIAAVMPGPSGACGILLERKVPIILPDPERLVQEEEVAAPTDPALQATEDAALAFAGEVGQAPPVEEVLDTEVPAGDTVVGSLRAIEKGTPEYEAARAQVEENGALAARGGLGILQALQTAAGETIEAPQAGLVTPDPIANPMLGGRLTPAAGYSAAADILAAMNGPDFGSLKAD